jgi:porphobilinogen synthase
MAFPAQRPRRLRRTEALRSMTRETRLSTSGFIYPMFVGPGNGTRVEISSMPGVYQQINWWRSAAKSKGWEFPR